MDHLLSKTESYSRAMTEKVAGDFFSRSEFITGEQILSITPIEQVNLFIVRNLFEKWKEESEKLKSPYFDYEKQEVKTALEGFMAVLSKNISVKREFFKPLLQKAVHDTLLLLLDPDQFFEDEFKSETIALISLKEQKKYFRIGKDQITTAITMLEKEGKELLARAVAVRQFKIVFQQNPLAEQYVQKILSDFSSVLPFEIQQESVKENIELPGVSDNKSIKQDPVKEVKTLNEKFAGNQLTLNDVLKSSESVSLAEKIGKSKVQNIREVISLNQKFMFITTLFQGERTEYENALNYIERSATYEEAYEFLESNYASKYQWENGKPELLELKELIYRKFS